MDAKKALEIFYQRIKVGTLSQDYGKTVDDVLHIDDAKELDCIEDALNGLVDINQRAETRIDQINNAISSHASIGMKADEIIKLIKYILNGEM